MNQNRLGQLDQAGSVESHDVTVRDHILLILAAVLPFTAATVWYVLS